MSVDVLAIAAHPDDVEQTCGGTMIKMAEMGYRTGVLDLTAGDMGTRGSPEQRVAESEVAGKHMLLKWRDNLHFPDARLENTLTARMTLAVKIRELKPRVVVLPYWEARHPDHYRASESVSRPARRFANRRILRTSPSVQILYASVLRRSSRRSSSISVAVRAPHDGAVELYLAVWKPSRALSSPTNRRFGSDSARWHVSTAI